MLPSIFPPFLKKCFRHRLALSLSCSKTTRCFSPEGKWYLIIKLPPIRALEEVIYFAYVKEGAKLHEPFPHTPAEISSRAAVAPQRERGILRGLSETRALETMLTRVDPVSPAAAWAMTPPLPFPLSLPSSPHSLSGERGTTNSLFTTEKICTLRTISHRGATRAQGVGGGDWHPPLF